MKSVIYPLASHYSGDEAWREWVDLLSTEWSRCVEKERLIEAVGGREDIAIVVYALLRGEALPWLHSKVDAIGGHRPVDCLESEPALRNLKQGLMRFPV